jgi:ribosomal protein L20A (L18A)
MSNEEHIEEMFYHAYSSGVVTKFRKKIEKVRKKTPNLNLCEVTEKVYHKMTKKGLILDEVNS